MSTPPPRHRSQFAERLARRREQHLKRSRLYRIAFGIAGALVTLAGVAMLVPPGPALRRHPDRPGDARARVRLGRAGAREGARQGGAGRARAPADASPAQKALGIALTVAGIAAFVTAAILWDIPVLPV